MMFLKRLGMACLLVMTFVGLQAQKVRNEAREIDYMVVFDNSSMPYVEKNGGEKAFAEKMVERFNLILSNSHLDFQFRVAGTMHIDATMQTVSEGLSLLENSEDVREKRKEWKADLVVMIIDPKYDNGNSGVSFHNANRWTAFSCVRASNALHYTAVHEAGHTLGCYHAHNSAHSPASNETTAAAFIGKKHITVMCSGMSETEERTYAPIFSGLESVYDGEVLGDARSNNVAWLRHMLPKAARWGDFLDTNRCYAVPESFSVNREASQLSVDIYAPLFFAAKCDADWVNVSLEGKLMNGYVMNDGRVNLELAPNLSGKRRTAFVTIYGPPEMKKVQIRIEQSDKDVAVGLDEVEKNEVGKQKWYDLWGKAVGNDYKGMVVDGKTRRVKFNR